MRSKEFSLITFRNVNEMKKEKKGGIKSLFSVTNEFVHFSGRFKQSIVCIVCRHKKAKRKERMENLKSEEFRGAIRGLWCRRSRLSSRSRFV